MDSFLFAIRWVNRPQIVYSGRETSTEMLQSHWCHTWSLWGAKRNVPPLQDVIMLIELLGCHIGDGAIFPLLSPKHLSLEIGLGGGRGTSNTKHLMGSEKCPFSHTKTLSFFSVFSFFSIYLPFSFFPFSILPLEKGGRKGGNGRTEKQNKK